MKRLEEINLNKHIMKRNLLTKVFVSLFTVVAVCSCNKNDDDGSMTINATVENGSSYNIDELKAEIGYETRNDNVAFYVVASSPYEKGNFTLKLPATVDAKYLIAYDEEDFSSGLTVSNYNALLGFADIYAYESGEETGEVVHGTAEWYSRLVYADEKVDITGSFSSTEREYGDTYTYTEKFNLLLKRGWNIMYLKESSKTSSSSSYEYIIEFSTQAPSGAKWYYDAWYSESASSSITKKMPFLSKSKSKKNETVKMKQ